MSMLWVNSILGLNFISFCFKLITIHYHTLPYPKTKGNKLKPRIKLNHNIYNTLRELLLEAGHSLAYHYHSHQ